jgi:nitroreductase
MNSLKSILKRRSIRKFLKKCPADKDIKMILEAARWAPSGLNNQPWRFIIIKDVGKKNFLSGFSDNGRIIKDAPVLIIVCLDLASSYNRDKDLMAIGACIENLLLAVTSLRLGACWLGEIINRKKEVSEYLKLNKNIEIMAVVALGFPGEKVGGVLRKPLESLIIES